MKCFEIIQEIGSDIGPFGEDYRWPYLRINSLTLKENGFKVGDKVKITLTKIQ